MARRKGMKLDQALKLYITLYVVCFLLTWLIAVPMLLHVTPQSECLLFVSPYVKYGHPASCNIVGILPLFVAVAALVLIVLHYMQLRSLKAFLRKPGPHSSDYHNRPTHIFWRMVVFHIIVTLLVLTITAILTAGYIQTCQNLYLEVRNTVRARVETEKWGTGQSTRSEIYDVYANDQSINRYTNPNRDTWGRSSYEYGITCRNILTDPEVHSQLKMNHAANPYYKQYYGFWYKHDIADVGDIRYYTYRNNMILELCMAGSWISFVLWTIILILMVKERHHIKAHLTDESMWGSEYGSRRSGSRMSSQSYDRSRGTRSVTADQMSYQGSVRSGPPSRKTSAHAAPQHIVPLYQPPPDNLMSYFASNLQSGPAVDVDGLPPTKRANGFHAPQHHDSGLQLPEVTGGPMDTSFGSGGLPDNLVNYSDDRNNDPIPLGDEVSQAYSSNTNLNEYAGDVVAVTQDQLAPSFRVATAVSGYPKQQGRRGTGARSSSSRASSHSQHDRHGGNVQQQQQQYSFSSRQTNYSHHHPSPHSQRSPSILRHSPRSSNEPKQKVNFGSLNAGSNSQQQFKNASYKTHLGNQSMI